MKDKSHLGYLDGIRGGAALWVIIAHCGIWGGWIVLPNPKIAVEIFMVMSGYLMTYHFARESISWDSAAKFWIRRFFRIAPLYYVVLIGVFLIAPWIMHTNVFIQSINADFWGKLPIYDPARLECRADDFLTHITFLFGLFPKYASSVPLPDWSIGLEMQFYVAFPLLLLLMRRIGHLTFVVGTLMVGYAVKRYIGDAYPEPSFLPLRLSFFVIGMLAASAHKTFDLSVLRRALVVILTLALASRQSPYVLMTTSLVLYLGLIDSARLTNALSSILSNGFTRFLADMSYSVYLIHGLFITLVGGILFRYAPFMQLSVPVRVGCFTVLVILLTYLVGVLLHRWIEKPGIALGKKLIDWWKNREKDLIAPNRQLTIPQSSD